MSLAQSIYSYHGLGSLDHQGMINNAGMGEVGISNSSLWQINIQNPANLIYNRFSTFQLGFEFDNRNISFENTSGSDFGARIRLLAYAFPIKSSKWSSALGVLPYSNVNYNIFSRGEVSNTQDTITQLIDNKGTGGLSSFFWAHGVALQKNIYLGVRFNYIFGFITKTSNPIITGKNIDISNSSLESHQSHADFNVQLGFSYRAKLQENKTIHFGFTYIPAFALKGNYESTLNRVLTTNREIESLELINEKISIKQPAAYGFGVSYQSQNKFIIGMDFGYDKWSHVATSTQPYFDFLKVGLGVEWIPDFDNVSSYFKRLRYQFGLNYQRYPYIENSQPLSDFGITFGSSLRVNRFSSVDLALKLGQLGSNSLGQVSELYFKLTLGATINDTWFIRRKYD